MGSETALAVANSISRLVKTSNPEYILGPFIFRAGTMTITILGKNYGNHLQARNDASTVDSIVVSSSNNCITSPPGILLQPRTILQLTTQLHVKLVAVELRCWSRAVNTTLSSPVANPDPSLFKLSYATSLPEVWANQTVKVFWQTGATFE